MPTTRTKTDIFNFAMSAINQSLITNENEQTQQTRLCQLWFDQMRQEVLRACDWTFARRTQVLALIGQLTTSTNFPDWANPNADPPNPSPGNNADLTTFNALQPYAYLYRYPSQCLYITNVYNTRFPSFPGSGHDPFYNLNERRMVGDRILDYRLVRSPVSNEFAIASNLTDARVDFVADITDVSQFDPLFVRALAYAIAKEVVMPLTGDANVAKNVELKYTVAISEAKRINYSESPENAPRDSSYERAREWG